MRADDFRGEAVLAWGDPRPGNIIWREGPDGAVAAVTDFEAAAIAPPELDFARPNVEELNCSMLMYDPPTSALSQTNSRPRPVFFFSPSSRFWAVDCCCGVRLRR